MNNSDDIVGQLLFLTHKDQIKWEFDERVGVYFFIKKITNNKYLKFYLYTEPGLTIDIFFVEKTEYTNNFKFVKQLKDDTLIQFILKYINKNHNHVKEE